MKTKKLSDLFESAKAAQGETNRLLNEINTFTGDLRTLWRQLVEAHKEANQPEINRLLDEIEDFIY